MAEWTETAEAAFVQYAATVRRDVAETGADPDEVIDDLRRHVEARLTEEGILVVAGEDVRRVLDAMGRTGEGNGRANVTRLDAPAAVSDASPSGAGLRNHTRIVVAILVSIFGVLLPTATLTFEVLTGACADLLFDPLPTWWHAGLIATVPLINAWGITALLLGRTRFPRLFGIASAATICIALYYAVAFLPVTPFAVIGILYAGIGLLPLSPLLSGLSAVILRVSLRRQQRTTPHPLPGMAGFVLGGLLAVMALLALELPRTLTTVGLYWAASDNPQTARDGVRYLRGVGSEQQLLDACYPSRQFNADLVSVIMRAVIEPVTIQEARSVFYRVTGRPFNMLERPAGRWRGSSRGDFFGLDAGLGGDMVAERVEDLYLQESRLDASVDPDACIVYTEWTMVFRNDFEYDDQEARMQLVLPSGGVATRVTLWVDGEEREAAFASRAKVKEAYQSVVRRNRDPLLVTTEGGDRVLVQCYPVPRDGGTMKIRVGITAPLVLDSLQQGTFCFPSYGECNFGITEQPVHNIWIESDRPLDPGSGAGETLTIERPPSGPFAVRGAVTNAALARGIAVKAQRAEDVRKAWTHDPRGDALILQNLDQEQPIPPERLVVVVDPSTVMGPHIDRIIDVLQQLPASIDVRILVAGDATMPLERVADLTSDLAARQHWFRGGFDNVPALLEAWDIAATAPSSGTVLWLHGPQPLPYAPVESLRQCLERRPGNPTILHICFAPGFDVVASGVDGTTSFRAVPRVGEPIESLRVLIAGWRGEQPVYTFARHTADALPPGMVAKQTSLHLARLWAFDRVREELGKGTEADRKRCLQLAATYHLVTSVSGAVVLENQDQYKAADLTPVDASDVPIVPEPEVWMLLCVVAVAVAVSQSVKWWKHGRFRKQNMISESNLRST